MIGPFRTFQPQLGLRPFVADNATLLGDVRCGDDVSIWFQAVVRGDVNRIFIGDGTNIQDAAVVHVARHRHPTIIGPRVTVGHGAILHGCTIGEGCLIGIGARVLDGATVGAWSIVAAGAVVTPGKTFEPRSMIMGTPAKASRQLSDAEVAYLDESWRNYVRLKNVYLGLEDDGELFYDTEAPWPTLGA